LPGLTILLAVGPAAEAQLATALPVTATQAVWVERLPGETLAVTSPATRVRGEPGQMQVVETSCQSQPMAGVRQRIVSIALQEWAYFGFSVADETVERAADFGAANPSAGRGGPPGVGEVVVGGADSLDNGDGFAAGGEPFANDEAFGGRRFPRNFSWMNPEQSARLAGSIAGYWAITGDGAWIIDRQNQAWTDNGVATRWRDPWSAAFISWVMCESGIAESSRFDRAINHHTYIDQAIVARDGANTETAYLAYDVGEQPIEAGDLLCAARRPTYDSLDERRSQLGDGIRSHCDIVVKLEPEQSRVLAVGGNVRGSVSLKLLAADFVSGEGSASGVESVGRGRGQIFAHLKLRAEPLTGDAVRTSPTLQKLGEQPELLAQVRATLDRAVQALSDSIL
jgi:hypothetical protein